MRLEALKEGLSVMEGTDGRSQWNWTIGDNLRFTPAAIMILSEKHVIAEGRTEHRFFPNLLG